MIRVRVRTPNSCCVLFIESWNPAYHADLLETVRKYISLRIQLASRLVDTKQNEMDFSTASDAEAMQVDQPAQAAGSPHRHQQVNGDEASNDARKASPTASVARSLESSSVELPASKETTRTLLQHIAQVSEEALHASEEKVNIAQTAYETVLHLSFRSSDSHTLSRLIDISVFWTKLSRSKRHLSLLELVQGPISLRYFFLTSSYHAGHARPA